MKQFTKMHGIGNDYIYFDCTKEEFINPEAASIQLSDRHKGVGGDGIVLIMPSDQADFRMRMFNTDGSEGKMCGNATRCIGKYVFERGLTSKKSLTLETMSGIKQLTLLTDSQDKVTSVTVDMGAPILAAKNIPVLFPKEQVINEPVTVLNRDYHMTCVSMGNPHCVVFLQEDPDQFDLHTVGPVFETLPIFPDRINTEFVRVLDDQTLQMRVWERGSGETMACGTGACATVVAAVESGFCKEGQEVTVKLTGGDLYITYTGSTVLMRGGASFVFDGTLLEE